MEVTDNLALSKLTALTKIFWKFYDDICDSGYFPKISKFS